MKNRTQGEGKVPSPSSIPRTAQVMSCPVCWQGRVRTLFRTHDRLHAIAGEFVYQRCLSCRTVFQNPRVIPDDIELCYPADYYTHVPVNAPPAAEPEEMPAPQPLRQARDSLRRAIVAAVQGAPLPGLLGGLGSLLAVNRRMRERAFYDRVIDELIPRANGRLRALDVGCGDGYLMTVLRSVGWEVEGVEWDAVAAESARRLSGRLVWNGDFRRLDLPLAAYDLIVLSHVFEHLDDPLAALRRIGELLADGGRAVLLYPNPESLGARLYRRDWFPWEPPRHLVLPPGQALAEAARQAGLSALGIRTTAKRAAAFLAHSRAYRAGRQVNLVQPEIGPVDRLAATFERLMAPLGLNFGEEVIVALQKNSD